MTSSIEHSPAEPGDPAFAGPPAEAVAAAEPLHRRLRELGLAHETRWHPPVFTVEESAALRGLIPGAHTKNLFVKDKKGRLFLFVCEETTPVNLKGVHRLVGAQGRVSFAGADALNERLGVTPGSVTAFAAMNDPSAIVTLVLEEALLAHETINAHPLTNHGTTAIGRDDLLTFLLASGHRPIVVDFRKAADQDTETGAAS